MQFLYPNFLWALTALAIPVIIHLFYFRRFKKVYFTNVRFLRELKKETSARSRLRNLLLLLMRLLAIAALVFAFAQPFIPLEKEVRSGDRLVSVFVDNSFSMSQTVDNVPLIDQAKEKAREIIRNYNNTDRFQVLTNKPSGREQFLLSREDALRQIDDISLTPETRNGTSISRTIREADRNQNTLIPVAYILSDFQKQQFGDLDLNDTTTQWNLVPLGSIRQSNVGIDSAWFAAPVQLVGQSNQLLIRIRNYGEQAVENIRLTWQQDGQQKPEGTINLEGGASKVDTINFQPSRSGWQSIKLNVTDYPIQFDDDYHLAYNARANVTVLLIHDGVANPYLKAAFAAPGYFSVREEQSNRINYSTLSDYDLVILQSLDKLSSGLEKELLNYMENGGNTLVFPGIDKPDSFVGETARRLGADPVTKVTRSGEFDVARINESSFVFRNVFSRLSSSLRLPKTTVRLEYSRSQRSNSEWLMRYADGLDYMLRYPVGDGNLFTCATPINTEYNDLVKQAEIFVPMLFRMAVSASSKRRPAYTIGKDRSISLDVRGPVGDESFRVKTEPEFIPAVEPRARGIILYTSDQVSESGVFPLVMGDTTLALLAFNYDRVESGQDFLSAAELEEQQPNAVIWEEVALGNFGQRIQEMDRGIILWKWFVVLALIFLALETLILRFWRQ